jgi:hypothetical protein
VIIENRLRRGMVVVQSAGSLVREQKVFIEEGGSKFPRSCRPAMHGMNISV